MPQDLRDQLLRTHFAPLKEQQEEAEFARSIGLRGTANLIWGLLNNDPPISDEIAASTILTLSTLLPVSVQPISDLVTYRARIGEFSAISDINSPPAELVDNFGRINIPRSSFFYASSGANATLAEIGAKPGDTVTILVTMFKEIRLVQLGFEIGAYIGAHPSHLVQALRAKLRLIVESESANDLVLYELLSSFINRAITAPGSHVVYRITALTAHYISAWLGHEADGFMYPAMRTTLDPHLIGVEHVNFAMRPQSVARLGEFQEVRIAQVIEGPQRKLDYIITSAIPLR